MAEVRLSKLMKQFNVGLARLVSFLNDAGCPVEENPNAKIDYKWIEVIAAWAADRQASNEIVTAQNNNDPGSTVLEQEIVLTKEPTVEVKDTPLESQEQPLKETSPEPVDSSEWESIVKHAIKAIPSPRTKEVNQFIIEKIASWLREDEIDLAEEPFEQEPAQNDKITAQEVIERIHSGEPGFIEACFAIDDPASIKEKRALISQVLQLEALSPEYFWYFVNSLLSLNADAYRAAISSSLSEYEYGQDYVEGAKYRNEFCAASEMLFKNRDKVHQALPFFTVFKNCLPEVVRQDIQNATKYLKSIEDLNLAFSILDSSLHEKLYLLSVNETPASQFLGFSILKECKDKEGIEAVRKQKYLPTYMNCIYETLAWCLIKKLVLEEEDTISDDKVQTILSDGYNSYVKYLDNAKVKIQKIEHSHAIQDYLGRRVYFRYESDNQWNIYGSPRDGYGYILPKNWVSEEMQKGEWYYATVVKFAKRPNILVLSQITVTKAAINGASTVHENDIVEARFSLYEKSLSTKILGCGPTSAQLVSIPRNFDYKIKHCVRVLKVYDVNKCEIQIVK